MIEKVTEYSLEQSEALRNLVKNDSLIINHVVMEPHQTFPAHVTEHAVFIIIVSGSIEIRIDRQPAHTYGTGKMVSLPKGVVSGIANPSDILTELFVVKSIIN